MSSLEEDAMRGTMSRPATVLFTVFAKRLRVHCKNLYLLLHCHCHIRVYETPVGVVTGPP
jgi:hypothetical protein